METQNKLKILKRAGEKNLFLFGKEIIGNHILVPHVHGDLAQWVEHPDRRRVRKFNGSEFKAALMLVMLPRDSLKTTFLSTIRPLWKLCCNPDARILIDSEARDLSKAILKSIKAIIDGNDIMKVLWGDMNGSSQGHTWNLDQIRVATRKDYKAKEDSIETSGIDVAITGRHYPVIIMDDLHSERNVTSREQIQKVIDHIQYMMPLLEPDGELLIVGTRWMDGDAYEWVMNLKDDNGAPLFDTYIKPAILESGQVLFPERLNKGVLAMKQATMSEEKYSAQYLLDPIPAKIAPLKKEDLKFVEPKDIPKDLNRFMMCDTIGDKKSDEGAWFAVTTWGIQPKLNELGQCNIYLIDGYCGAYDTDQQIEAIIALYLKTRPIEFGIERAGMGTLHIHLKNNLRAKNLSLHMGELKPSGRGKDQRIQQFIPYSKNGMVHINKNANEELIKEFVYEWTRFPKSRRKDVIDCSAYIFDYLEKYPPSMIQQDNEEDEDRPKRTYIRNSITGY